MSSDFVINHSNRILAAANSLSVSNLDNSETVLSPTKTLDSSATMFSAISTYHIPFYYGRKVILKIRPFKHDKCH